jgi:hypothetical protein
MIIYKFEIRSPTMTILRSPRAQLFFFQEKKKKKKNFFYNNSSYFTKL